jgi:hypothetical protein
MEKVFRSKEVDSPETGIGGVQFLWVSVAACIKAVRK